VTPFTLALFSSFVAKTGGDVIVGAIYFLIMAFDPPTIGALMQSPGVSLMAFLLVLAHVFAHNILKGRVYCFGWFVNLLLSWAVALTGAFIRPDIAGSLTGLAVYGAISAFSEVGAATGHRARQMLQSGKMLLIANLVGIPLMIAITAARLKWGGAEVVHARLTLAEIGAQFRQRESAPIWALILLSFLLFRRAEHSYRALVPLLAGVIGGIASLWLPVESPGNTVEVRMFFARFNFLLAAAMIGARLKNQTLKYGLPALAFLFVFVLKAIVVFENVKANPPPVRSFL
jgi:hypothetical protein